MNKCIYLYEKCCNNRIMRMMMKPVLISVVNQSLSLLTGPWKNIFGKLKCQAFTKGLTLVIFSNILGLILKILEAQWEYKPWKTKKVKLEKWLHAICNIWLDKGTMQVCKLSMVFIGAIQKSWSIFHIIDQTTITLCSQ